MGRTNTKSSEPKADTSGGWASRGADIYKTAEKEKKRQESSSNSKKASRFWMPPDADAEREVIILDNSMDEVMAFFEHNLKNPQTGKYDTFEPCPKEFEECPLCKDKSSYYVTYLTVIDTKEWETKGGDKVPGTRRLFPIKYAQLFKFKKLFDIAMKKYGTLRGVSILLTRTDKKHASIGEPVADEEGQLVGLCYNEKELEEHWGHDDLKGDDGTVYAPANQRIQPFEYGKLFPKPSAKRLREIYGGDAPVGSDESNAWENEETPKEETEEEPTPRRRARSRSVAKQKEATDLPVDEEEDVPFE